MPNIEVELPDGSIVEFPDNMTPAQINAAIVQHLRKPEIEIPELMGSSRPTREQLMDVPRAVGRAVRDNPQDVLDFAGSGLGAAGGMAAGGAVGGPAGAVVGGGAGAALGKTLARKVGSFFGLPDAETPTRGELALDAAAGAVGPAAGALAKPATRFISGISRRTGESVVRAREAVQKAAQAAQEAEQAAATSAKGATIAKTGRAMTQDPDVLSRLPPGTADAVKAAAKKVEQQLAAEAAEAGKAAKAADKARKKATKQARKAEKEALQATSAATEGRFPKTVGDWGAALTAILHGDLTTAGLIFGGGRVLSAGQARLAQRILDDPAALKWLSEKGPGLKRSTQVLGSLTALAATQAIRPETRRDIHAFVKSLQGERDEKGRFKPRPKLKPESEIDHSGLIELFGGAR